MATLENFDAQSLALDFSPLLKIKEAMDLNKNRALAERKIALDEEVRRGTLDVAEADLILRQEAAETAQSNQQSIQDTLSQLISPTQAPTGQTTTGQGAPVDTGGVPAQVPQTAPPANLEKRDELILTLGGLGKEGPALAKLAESVFAGRDARAKEAFTKEINAQQAFALSLKRMKTREQQDRAISNEIRKQARTGTPDPFLQEFLNMNDADREQALFMDIAQGDVLQKMAENELIPQERFILEKDGQGNIIGQRSSTTGKLVTDPRKVTKTSIEKNLDAAGITDPAVRKDLIVKSITKPPIKIDINEGLGYKIPIGFMLTDPNDPRKGVTPIPGGPKDTITGENAGKVQMLRTAKKAFKGVRDLVFDFDKAGEVTGLKNFNLFNANLSIPFTDIRGVPFTDGDLLRARMEFGIQAITRIETGAAMPDSEIDNTRSRFTPKVTDTKEIAQIKLDMYEDFVNGTIQLIDPSGRLGQKRFNPQQFNERFDTEFNNRMQGGARPQLPATQPAAQVPAAQPQRSITVDF